MSLNQIKYYTRYSPPLTPLPVTLCDSLVSLRVIQNKTMMKTARMTRRITMTTATTTPTMTAVSTEVEDSVRGAVERNTLMAKD